MGVMYRLFLIYYLFISLNILAENPYDTVYFSDKKFVEHRVQAGESLRSIADLHNVTTSSIKKSNDLSDNIYYAQLLYIPVYLNDTLEGSASLDILNPTLVLSSVIDSSSFSLSSPTDTIKVALLMPYMASYSESSSMYDHDTLPKNKMLESVLSFHIGIELAIDSLRRTGKKIILYSFDTKKDSMKVQRIISSNQLSDMDLIIGPMFSDLFYLVCKRYGADTTKVLVSPLSRQMTSYLTTNIRTKTSNQAILI